MVASGVIRTSPNEPFPARLLKIFSELQKIVADYRPETAAVESVFHAANARTALKLAHVRGVALVAAAEAGLSVGEYSPLEIKGSVVGYGRADKKQVQLMVGSLLGLEKPIASLDACDALAAAICHANRSHTGRKVAAGGSSNA